MQDKEIKKFSDKIFDSFSATSKNSYLFVCDLWTDISRWSRNAVEYFGLPNEYMECAGKIWEEHIHPEDREAYKIDIEEVFAGRKEVHDIEYRAKDKDGNYVVCSCHGVLVKNEHGSANYFVGTITNHGIIDNVDPTTNLYNLYEFLHQIRKYRESNTSYKVLMLGFSHFSDINDVYGYTFGNDVMRLFAVRVLEILQKQGILFRMDGTRFAICTTQMELEQLQNIYDQIQVLAKQDMIVRDNNVALSVCGGVVIVDDVQTNEHVIHTAARYALDSSKKEKYGELVVVHNEDLAYQDTNKTVKLLDVMRNSVLDNCKGFYMCYQPVVSTKTGRLVGMESLLRWHGEPYGEVSPNLFIPWLEKDNVFFELGNWILKQSLTDGKEFLKDHPDIILNVNVSYAQLERSEFRNSFVSVLLMTGFPPEHLCLELTERCRFMDMNFLRNELSFLKSYGVKIALDDFGTGFASLDLLRELNVDLIKIDRSFTKEIEDSKVTQSIVRALTQCASELGINVCVEGIENEELLSFMNNFASTSYQGYYYSKPVQKEEFKKLDIYRG